MEDDPLIGAAAGKYRIERLIGVGGMSRVYAGRHQLLDRQVAIKVLSPEYSNRRSLVARFFNEAKAAASLRHSNIIDVLDFDWFEDGRSYMVLEYLEGETLTALLRREGPLDGPKLLELLGPVCSAISAAHAGGIVHRDLKPSNIFLVRRAGADRLVKVLDFGIAKLRTPGSATSDLTRPGMVMGTPTYMSPEQALALNDEVGPASDIYSLGVIAWQLLTGRPPFDGDSTEVVIKHVHEPPPRLRDVPVGLARVVEKALAKKPIERWATAEDLLAALTRAVASPASTTEAVTVLETHRARKTPLRPLVAVCVLLAVAAVATWLGRGRPAPRAVSTAGVPARAPGAAAAPPAALPAAPAAPPAASAHRLDRPAKPSVPARHDPPPESTTSPGRYSTLAPLPP